MVLEAVDSYISGYHVTFEALHDLKSLPTSQNIFPNETVPHEEIQELQHKLKQRGCVLKEYLFVFSAHDQSTLLRNIAAVSEAARPCDAFNLCYTLGSRRTRFRYGAFGIFNNTEVPEQLRESKMTFGIKASSEPVLAFAFTGNGIVIPTNASKIFS